MKIENYKFSFQELLGPGQNANPRHVEIMEVMDQLYDEFVYPELERARNLRSIETADEQDLDAINIDKYYYLFEEIQKTAKSKRIALWMQHEIIKAKNRDESILLATASLGLPRESLELVKLYSSKTKEYTINSLRPPDQIRSKEEYFLTSKKGLYLDQAMLGQLGFDPNQAQEAVKNVLAENVVPLWIELLILQKLYIDLSKIKVVASAKTYQTDIPIGSNTIEYRMSNKNADIKLVSSVKTYRKHKL